MRLRSQHTTATVSLCITSTPRDGVDAVAASRPAVRLYVEIQPARPLLWIDMARTLHGPYSVSNLTSFRFKFGQIRPKELDANLRSNTRREHVDAIDDRLCPDIGHARQGNGAVHGAFELRKRHAWSPLIAWFEMHDSLRHV